MELIFDRTQADLTNDTSKAYIAYTDLNRIEEACDELADLFGLTITTKEWQMSDFRTESEMARIRSNINLIMNSYYANPYSPALPSVINFASISEANNVEECLFRVKEIYDSVEAGKRRLSFVCGSKPLGNRGGA